MTAICCCVTVPDSTQDLIREAEAIAKKHEAAVDLPSRDKDHIVTDIPTTTTTTTEIIVSAQINNI